MTRLDKKLLSAYAQTENLGNIRLVQDQRGEVLYGMTYKVKHGEFSYYVTINSKEDKGTIVPYEIFIVTMDTSRYAALTLVTRLISLYLQTGGDPKYVVQDLKAIVSPEGGYWKNGKFYASFEAELGELLERHFETLRK